MAELAASGLTAEQQALLFELTAAVATEARPAIDKAAENKRAYDRDYRRKNRTKSYESAESLNGSKDKNPPDPIKTQTSNPPLKGSPPDLIPEHVVEAWNAMADRCGLPKAKLTPERRRKLTAQIRRRPIEDWTEAIGAVERSSFLRGENDRGWRADIDFLLQPTSFTKLIEGSYDRSAH